jgi:hypothetical protein
MKTRTNHPAPGKAGIPPQFTIGHYWPGLPEPGRWPKKFLSLTQKYSLRCLYT